MSLLYKKDPSSLMSMFLILFGIGFILSSILSIALTSFIFDIGLNDLGNITSESSLDHKNITILKTLQVFQSVLMFLIPAFLFARLADVKPLRFLNLNMGIKSNAAFYLMILSVIMIPTINFLTHLNSTLPLPDHWAITQWMVGAEDQAAKITKAFVETPSLTQFALNILIIGVLAAVGEELIFRGIFQNLLYRIVQKKWIVILVTAALFSAIHLQFLSFLPRFILGIYLGYLFHETQNLWYPIFAHFVNNTMAVCFYYWQYNAKLSLDVDTIGTPEGGIFYFLSSLPLTIVMLWWLNRKKLKEL